jgi:hypothetical protein
VADKIHFIGTISYTPIPNTEPLLPVLLLLMLLLVVVVVVVAAAAADFLYLFLIHHNFLRLS